MNIGLLNWSGHKNIGDDLMSAVITKALTDRGHNVINQGEDPRPEGIDAYFWGGGTLISQNGVFPRLPDVPVIGFGIGVCETPPSTYIDSHFANVKHVFARDPYSFEWLIQHNIPATLSFDPVFLLDLPKIEVTREYLAVNIIASQKTDYSYVKDVIKRYEGMGKLGFAVGLPEDPIGCDDFKIPCQFFDNPYKLNEFLSKAKVAITTRLHATVLAYMSGVPTIEPIAYDPKVTRFMEYVVKGKVSPKYMRERLNEHIDYALTMLHNIR